MVQIIAGVHDRGRREYLEWTRPSFVLGAPKLIADSGSTQKCISPSLTEFLTENRIVSGCPL
jgi:hypothetical protein